MERLERLRRILLRDPDNAVSVRDLCRTYGMERWELLQAEAAGWIQMDLRKPPTGRPSRVCRINRERKVNKNAPAELPRYRGDRNRPLSQREREFLNLYLFPYGMPRDFGGGYSAAWAYQKVYGRFRTVAVASARSAGARLARRSWMWAARMLDCRLSNDARDWPEDMRSHGRAWSCLVLLLDSVFLDWPREVVVAVARARTIGPAVESLKKHPLLKSRAREFVCAAGD